LLAAALLTFSAAPGFADDAADIAAIKAGMAALDQAFDSGNGDTIRALMTPDHVAVVFAYKGPQTVDEQIASLKDLKMETYDSIPPTVSMLGPDAALATSENSYRGTFEGNPLPQRVFVGEVWVRADGKWLQKFYQETIIEEE
jgi:ketosteroid isomerase-like protein